MKPVHQAFLILVLFWIAILLTILRDIRDHHPKEKPVPAVMIDGITV